MFLPDLTKYPPAGSSVRVCGENGIVLGRYITRPGIASVSIDGQRRDVSAADAVHVVRSD